LISLKVKASISIFAAVLVGTSACGEGATTHGPSPSPSPVATPAAQLQAETLNVDGVLRSYELFVPVTLDPAQPVPLVVILHPCPATAAQAAVGSHLDDEATSGRFVAVYPQGAVMAATGGTCWNAGSCCTGADDVGFISQLIDHLIAQLHVDKARVFITGFSFGASMAYRLGCQLSEKVVAIAPVSGALVFGACKPSRPVSVLMMQGTADTTFPYRGGGDYSVPSVASVVRLWAGLDGCSGAALQARTGIVTTTKWRSCRAGAMVRLDLISGAPHTWFGGEPNPLPGEPNANSTVWDFFNGLSPRT
jgi:polyhydroxybutyrate depolymerase